MDPFGGRDGDPASFPQSRGCGCAAGRWDLARSEKFCCVKESVVCSWFSRGWTVLRHPELGLRGELTVTRSGGSGPLRLSPETGELWVRWAGRRISALPLGILVPDAGHLNLGSRHPSRSLQLRVFSIWGGDSEQRGEEEGVVCHGDRKPQVGGSEQQY